MDIRHNSEDFVFSKRVVSDDFQFRSRVLSEDFFMMKRVLSEDFVFDVPFVLYGYKADTTLLTADNAIITTDYSL